MVKKSILSIVLIGLMLSIVGCNGVNNSKAQLVVTEKTFSSVVRQLTLAKQLGKFDAKQTAEITILIHQGQDCILQWDKSIADSNVPPPNVVQCINSSMIKLLQYQQQTK